MRDLWRFFECANPACDSKSRCEPFDTGTGVVLQVRMPISVGHLYVMPCPACGDPMRQDGQALATESGHLPERTPEPPLPTLPTPSPAAATTETP